MKNDPQRRYTRINVARKARLSCPEARDFPCRIKNLSLGGVYLFSQALPGRDAHCRVVFSQSAPGAEMAIRASARVVREEEDGMAMEFTSMAYDSYMLLKMVLLHGTDDPMAVSLEYTSQRPFQVVEPEAARRPVLAG